MNCFWAESMGVVQTTALLYIELSTTGPFFPDTPDADTRIKIAFLDLMNSLTYEVEGFGTAPYRVWHYNATPVQHLFPLFDVEDVKMLSVASALELADLKAESEDLTEPFEKCTLARAGVGETDLLYTFGYLGRRGPGVVSVDAKTKEAQYHPTNTLAGGSNSSLEALKGPQQQPNSITNGSVVGTGGIDGNNSSYDSTERRPLNGGVVITSS